MSARPRAHRRRAFVVAALGVFAAAAALTALWFSNPLEFLAAAGRWSRLRAGLATHSVQVGDHRWVYDERGAGDTLVLLHGFAGDRSDWYPMLPSLAWRGRLVIPDLPGWGDSARREDGDYGAAAQAARLAEFLGAIGATRVHLVGHSMGGKIAGLTAAAHPERVSRLTLVANSGVHFEPNDFARRILAGGNPFAVDSRADWQRLLEHAFVRPPALPALPARIVDALIAQNRRERAFLDRTLDALRRGPRRYALEPALPRLTMPVHVIWCRHDRLLDVSSIETMRPLIRDARYDVIEEGCGHMPMMEVPETLARLIVAADGRP